MKAITSFFMSLILTWVFGGFYQFSYALTVSNDLESRMEKYEERYLSLPLSKKIRFMKRQLSRINKIERKLEKISEKKFDALIKMTKSKNESKVLNEDLLKHDQDELSQLSDEESFIFEKNLSSRSFVQAMAKQSDHSDINLTKKSLLNSIQTSRDKIQNELDNLLQIDQGRNPSSGPYLLSGIGILVMISGLVMIIIGIPLLLLGIGAIVLIAGATAIAVGGSLIGIEMIIQSERIKNGKAG